MKSHSFLIIIGLGILIYLSSFVRFISNNTNEWETISKINQQKRNNNILELNLENLKFWSDDSICQNVNLESDLHMTSHLHSTFDIVSCDERNSSCKVKIVAVSWSAARKNVGGDVFLIWAEQAHGDGHSVGNVTDNGDGTYSSVINFYWSGESIIKAKLGGTLEVFCRRKAAMVTYGNSIFATKTPYGMRALFKKDADHEVTRCGIYERVQGYTELCNLTAKNDGSPWFCGKPNNPNLNCKDISSYSKGLFSRLDGDPSLDSPEVISKYGHGQLKRIITVMAASEKYKPPNQRCLSSSKRDSWFSSSGFYLNGKWNIPHCKSKMASSGNASRECLNKTFVVLGDSTVRAYASFFLKEMSFPLVDLKNKKGPTYHPSLDFKKHGTRVIF